MFLWIDLMRDMVHFIYKKNFINIQVITSLLIKKTEQTFLASTYN